MRSRNTILVCIWCLWMTLTGCATYSDTVRQTHHSVAIGDMNGAITTINQRLQVDHSTQLPANLEKDRVLLLLERGTLLQAIGDYEGARRDMMIADQHLDWLDMSSTEADVIAEWLYSASSAKYTAPAYERLYLNALNMVNFLALRDYEGARVEARRFSIIEKFFLDSNQGLPVALALGNYLGGVAFEAGRDYETAARYYSRAWHFGMREGELKSRLVALYQLTGYTPRDVDPSASGLDALIETARMGGRIRVADYRALFVEGSVIAIVQTGLVPYKKAERVPIGTAVYYAQRHPRHASPEHIQRANEMAVSGALKWVNFPTMTIDGLAYPGVPHVIANNTKWQPVYTSSVSNDVLAAWDLMVGPMIASALTRMITRAIAGAATREGTKALAESKGSGTAGVIGILAQLAVEGTMAALDKPDTRSWTTLPAAIRVYRSKIAPGSQNISVRVYDQYEVQTVDVRKDSLTVINFSKHR